MLLALVSTYDTFDVVRGVSITSQSLTNNSLWGGQFGAEATLWRVGNFDWYANGKYGDAQ